jgi:polysaccharide biosynthesis protein PslJ
VSATTVTRAAPSVAAPVQRDAVSLLSVYVLLLLAIPSDRYVPGIGAVGSPAALWGLGAGLWWVWYRLRGAGRVDDPRHGMTRRLVATLLVSVTLSYLVAMTRAIPPAEVNPADNGMLRMASWIGIALVAADGIPDRERLLALLRRISIGGGLFAVLGIVEFVIRRPIAAAIPIPGLTSAGSYTDLTLRGAFVRSSATAQHPLEYALVLSMILPIALTLAMTDHPRRRPLYAVTALLIVGALVLGGSRSAVIGLVLCILPLIPFWSARARGWLALIGVGVLAVVYVAAPGLLGTIRGLFDNVGSDSSSSSRTDSYGVFFEQFARSPALGRGFGTFLPMYRIFDNQYLGLLVEIGLLGTIAFLALIAVPGVAAVVASRARGLPPLLAALGPAIGGALLAGLVLTAFFDALSFPKAAGLLFLTAGIAGAYRTLAADPFPFAR